MAAAAPAIYEFSTHVDVQRKQIVARLAAVCGWPDLVMGSSTAWPHNLLTIPTLKGETPPAVWMIACGDRG
jgi:hypothetical protein